MLHMDAPHQFPFSVSFLVFFLTSFLVYFLVMLVFLCLSYYIPPDIYYAKLRKRENVLDECVREVTCPISPK